MDTSETISPIAGIGKPFSPNLDWLSWKQWRNIWWELSQIIGEGRNGSFQSSSHLNQKCCQPHHPPALTAPLSLTRTPEKWRTYEQFHDMSSLSIYDNYSIYRLRTLAMFWFALETSSASRICVFRVDKIASVFKALSLEPVRIPRSWDEPVLFSDDACPTSVSL